MSMTWDEIISIMRQRRTADAVLIQQMIEIRDRYNGEVIIPLPDVSGLPAANRPGPNFFQEGLDGLARLANAEMPKISCPAKNPASERSMRLSDIRQGALYGRWHESNLQLKMDRAYRHLSGYGTMAMIVMPDDVEGRANIELRDPLSCYPELRAPDDIRLPVNVGFLYARSMQWIAQHFPNAPQYLMQSADRGWETLWDVVEWIDEEDVVVGVMGPRFPPYGYADARPYGYNAIELKRWKNKAGIVPVVVPRRATLNLIMGQLTSMINYSDLYGRMLELQLVATEKAIFPDMALLSKTGMPPQLIGGRWKDGRSGDINTIVDGGIEVIGKEPGVGTIPMLQLVDNHIRSTSGASALYGSGNAGMRTGAGIDAIGDFGVNPMVAETQRIMARSLQELNRAVIAVDKGYYGDKTFTVILGLGTSQKTVTFTPAKDFDSDANMVTYANPGADINKLAVAATQLVATDIISRRTARAMHPLVDDPDEEEQFVSLEKMSDAVLAGAAQEIAQGQMPTSVVARMAQLVASGKTVYDAILQAQAEVASQGPAPGAPGGAPPVGPPGGSAPGQPIPPGLAQALAAQGAGPSAPVGAGVPGAPPALMNLRHVLQGVNEQVSAGAT